MKISFDNRPKDRVYIEADGTLLASFARTGYLKSIVRIRLSRTDEMSVESFTSMPGKKNAGDDENSPNTIAPHGLVLVTERSGAEKVVVVERFMEEHEANEALALVKKALISRTRSIRIKGALRTFAFYAAIPILLFTLHGAVMGEFETRKLSKDMMNAVINKAGMMPGSPVATPSAANAASMVKPALKDSSFIKTGLRFGVKDSAAEKTLYVFSDPNCPACKELEGELHKLYGDFSVYVFPLAFKPGSEKLSAQVLCAKDPEAKWGDVTKLPLGGTIDGDDSCANAKNIIQSNMAAFNSLGFNKTPTILAGDGQIFTGSIPADSLRKMMQEQRR